MFSGGSPVGPREIPGTLGIPRGTFCPRGQFRTPSLILFPVSNMFKNVKHLKIITRFAKVKTVSKLLYWGSRIIIFGSNTRIPG